MSRASRRDEPPELFVDRSLGSIVVPGALEACGFIAHRMADHYGNHLRETSDVSWIEAVTKRGWVILTKDTSIKRNAAEKAAVCEAKARMFCLSRGNLTGRQMAERFVAHLGSIQERSQESGPYIYTVLADRLERIDLPTGCGA